MVKYTEKGHMTVSPKNVRKAARHLQNIYDTTPLFPLENFERDAIKINLLGKFENVHSMYTFKVRGAEWYTHKLMKEYENKTGRFEDKDDGEEPVLITASAGNHAQGVALAANRYGLKALIYMPKSTPGVKQKRVRDLGAEVVLVDGFFDDALAAARQYKENNKNAFFVPPYENPDIMEGQATIGFEILSQMCPYGDYIKAAECGYTNWQIPDVIICPLGGGGLASGIGAVVKEFNEKTGKKLKVIGVQTETADSMYNSIRNEGLLQESTDMNATSNADGIAVKKASERMIRTVKEYVDRVVLVSEESIKKSIAYIHQNSNLLGTTYRSVERKTPCAPRRNLPGGEKSLMHRKRHLNKVEGAAAAPYAAVVFGDIYGEINWKEIAGDKKEINVACVLTGSNISDEKYNVLKNYVTRPERL